MKQKELLKIGINKLEESNVEDAKIKAKQLLIYILKETKEQYIINVNSNIDCEDEKRYIKYINQITEGKPLQYITNNQEFMGIDFYVNENVLIPQPDTEILVEETLKIIKKEKLDNEKCKILDLCTGSGCIATSVGFYTKECKIFASDISSKALEVAKINIENNNLQHRINEISSNLFEDIDKNFKFDIIVSNPPYIETSVIHNLSKEVKNEPILALDGGEDGLKFYKEILEKSYEHLSYNGYLLFEIGYNQANEILKEYYKKYSEKFEVVTKDAIKDYSGNDRVLIFRKK